MFLSERLALQHLQGVALSSSFLEEQASFACENP
jgi:hypothetical protein